MHGTKYKSKRCMRGRTWDPFLSALQNTCHTFASVASRFSLPASCWCFLKSGKEKNKQPLSDCCLCCDCWHYTGLLGIRAMSPHHYPGGRQLLEGETAFCESREGLRLLSAQVLSMNICLIMRQTGCLLCSTAI